MTEQPQQPPQPNDKSVIIVQQREMTQLNSNRIYLMAILDEMKVEAETEIARLHSIISQLKGMLSEDVIEEAEKIIAGE